MESATSCYARRNSRSQALSGLSNRGAARRGRRFNCEWPGAGRKPLLGNGKRWRGWQSRLGGSGIGSSFSPNDSPHGLPRRRTENTVVVLNSACCQSNNSQHCFRHLPFRTCIYAGCSHSHSLRTGGSVDPANVSPADWIKWMTTASRLAIGSFAAFAAWVASGQSQTAISWCQTDFPPI
jgi:hypothetical protein